ncbi:MAG: PilT/PilU family type 4a pilus ATPase [Lachnospiraceae bacterium]|nr:PilT/PilU family type 4a pilus ATPase [Lachnospiraceae bacterium]
MPDLAAFVREAREKHASDIHFSVGAVPKLRIHGELFPTSNPVLKPSDTLELLIGFLSHEQRERFEKNGEIELSVSFGELGRLRVSAYKQRGNITMALRLVDQEIPNINLLQIPEKAVALTEEKKGLVILSGPAGSGKSSLTAAFINRINETRSCNIITLEDPIEFLHTNKLSNINQREIGLDSQSYEAALKSALRADPDVLVVSRITSCNELSLILTAVEAGRLCLLSLLTPSVTETLSTLTDSFPAEERTIAAYRLSDALKCVLSRQLLHPSEGESVPAYEVLFNSSTVREAIRSGEFKKLKGIMHESRDEGMMTMEDSLTELVTAGKINIAQALEAAGNPEELSEILNI